MQIGNWAIKRSPGQAAVLVVIVCAAAALAAFTWWAWGRSTSRTYVEVRSFAGADGSKPLSGLILDSGGAIYGVTQFGGVAGQGTVFLLKPPVKAGEAWNEVVLHHFGSENDGKYPVGELVFDKAGSLYGATTYGGAGHGSVFKLTPPATGGDVWTESVLYRFRGADDGANPWSGLVFDDSGALYGTTLWGGTHSRGAVFRLTPPRTAGGEWRESILYSFRGGDDGVGPKARLVLDAGGALYGTTESGGASDRGTVFKLTPPAKAGGAWIKSTLYSFLGGADGAEPFSAVVSGPDGSLYGATYYGGGARNCSGGCGIVFQLKPPAENAGKWTESVLYKFQGGANDGGNPSGVIMAADGSLFGAANSRGANLCGVVFQLSPPAKGSAAWKETILYNFPTPAAPDPGGRTQGSDVAEKGARDISYGGLALGRDGALFGVSPKGGVHQMGVVYELQAAPK